MSDRRAVAAAFDPPPSLEILDRTKGPLPQFVVHVLVEEAEAAVDYLRDLADALDRQVR